MAIKVGINGFGRIGRMVFRAAIQNFNDIEIVAINDLLEPDYLAYMLKYDSVHGRFKGEVSVDGGHLVVNGKKIRLTQERDPSALKWNEVHADVVIEATGVERIGRISHGCLGLYSDASMRAMAHIISFAKSVAPHVKFGVQIGHAGRKASSPTPGQGHGQIMPEAGGWHVVAPSPIPYDKQWQVPIETKQLCT